MTTPAGFKVTTELSVETIRNLLCCAFEGGSNYWYDIEGIEYPPGLKHEDYTEGGKGQDAKHYWHWSQLIPTQEGGKLFITTKGGDAVNGVKRWGLDRGVIQRGLDVMREKYPKQYANVLSENEDAGTGDCFLQCCLFGKIVFA